MREINEFSGLNPIHFFHLQGECRHTDKQKLPDFNSKAGKRFILPDTSSITGEELFADLALAWNEEGLSCRVEVNQAPLQSTFPNPERGDSVELFIDTRDVKTSGFNTRFCHHFFFLAEAVNTCQAGEATHFRTEDAHPLCDPKMLQISSHKTARNYRMEIFIPSQCLIGYDPSNFNRIGFTYRINRPDGPSQHYCVTSENYQIHQQPSLWSSLKLTP